MTATAIFGFGLSLVAAVYYLRIAYVLFAPAKKTCECKCQCADNAVFGYMLKFTVAAAAVALLVVGVFPSLALL